MNPPSKTIPWQRIQALDPAKIETNGSIAALDALRQAWAAHLADLPEPEKIQIRQRTLRRLAIETGIIERLYNIEWGLTLTLVAEGFSKDVIERTGGQIDEMTVETLKAQRDSLELVLDFVRHSRRLSTSFIKELHVSLARTQATYLAHDARGIPIDVPLDHGAWKTQANHVLRSDDTLLEYTPPEHVASEMDRLVDCFESLDSAADVHPIIKAAWLHHSFVRIHPFADGNGRVARALTMLVLERHKFAPLVVDRFHREDYLKALDSANDGDLNKLIKLFIRLESAALTGELESPPQVESKALSLDIAHTLADQLAELKNRKLTKRQKALEVRAIGIHGRIDAWCKRRASELKTILVARGHKPKFLVDSKKPPDPMSSWFRLQIIDSAHEAGHYADFSFFTAWTQLRLRLDGIQLRYVVSIHGAGKDAGVMAVTTFGEMEDMDVESPARESIRERIRTTTDAFRFVYAESTDNLEKRAGELEELLESGLSEALSHLLRRALG
ncbi:MAG TPA: hypothetical protein DD417_03860 [Elusimicrobia bacterium]|nr:hypothetical protein [Elusimicrobiota bacterium]